MGEKTTVKNLNFSYQAAGSALPVLENINLEIRAGEFFVLVGASGCGKTTLLRVMKGLNTPTSGEVFVGDHLVTKPDRDSGFVFQSDGLYPWRTILRNVGFGLEIQNTPRAKIDESARRMIKLVGLEGFENRYPHELSGGMRQRANLARALAIEPAALLMDEPFAALDAFTRQTMQQEVLRITEEAGTTVIFITHQIDEAVLLGDRIAVMGSRPGRIEAIIDNTLPKPRGKDIRQSAEFQKLVAEINTWISIPDDARPN